MKKLLFIFLMIASVIVSASPSEADYVNKFCKGDQEVVLPNRLRVDCIEGVYTLEYDWAPKWAECTGQALKYSQSTGKVAGCVLIVKNPNDPDKVQELYEMIIHFNLPMKLFTVTWDSNEPKEYTGN